MDSIETGGYVASLIALVVQSFTIVLLSLRVDALKERVRELQAAHQRTENLV